MSHLLVNKKRNILQSLNVHLQVQAIKLEHIDRDTNILPNSFLNNSEPKHTKALTSNISNRTFVRKEAGVVNNKVITSCKKNPTKQVRKLRPYDPLYTWNRGGRLKELRIRCQARKFFHIWMKKALGRINAAQATQFYRIQLIKKYWRTWYEQYWQLRIEPRLLGRAILYRKSIVMRSIFLGWQWWTKLRAYGRVKMEIAIKYHDTHLKKNVINVWLSWVFIRKCKMKLISVGDNWSKNKLLVHFMNVWKTQLIVQRDMDAKTTIALRHYRIIALNKVFQQWIEVGPCLKRDKVVNSKAASFHQNLVMKKCFEHWIRYHHGYKMKQRELDKWQDHYHWNLAQRYLKTWRERYLRSLTMSVVDIKISELRKRFQIRRIFGAWRCYIEIREERKKACSKAANFNWLSLKRKMWSKMIMYCERSRQKTDLRMRAREFNDKITLQRHFNKWSDMLECKEDQMRTMELGAARAHYRNDICSEDRTTLIKCFRHFSLFVAHSNQIKERNNVSDTFRRHKVLRRSIIAWRQHVSIAKSKKTSLQIKNDYVKDRLIGVAWTVWRRKTAERVTGRDKLNEFVNRKVICDKSKLLGIWRAKTDYIMTRKNATDRARLHYRDKLLYKCVGAMKLLVQQGEKWRSMVEVARDHYSQRIMCKTLRAMASYVKRKRLNSTVVSSHISINQYKRKRKLFDAWREYVEERSQIYCTVEAMFNRKIIEETQMKFNHWRKVARTRRTKRDKSLRLEVSAKRQMELNLKLRIIHYWKARALDRNYQTSKYAVASGFYEQNITLRCFNAWKLYRDQERWKVCKREQSSWFWHKSQLTIVWVAWNKALVNRQREEYYTKFALSHWASKLQEKVFQSWLTYKRYQKDKHESENDAFTMFQRRAQRYTIGKWLRSGDFLCQWRESQSKPSHNESTFVSRAFTHWRQWTVTRVNKSRVIKVVPAQVSIDVTRPKLKSSEQSFRRNVKPRSAPKIPDFLLKPLDRSDHSERISQKCQQSVTLPKNSPTESSDDILLSPASFSASNVIQTRPSKDQSRTSYMQELDGIKERLQRFKDTKESLSKLREEVLEYDRVLSQLTLDKDSSFCEEFNPLGYREQLVSHIKEMEKTLVEELPICNQLTKRAQTIVNICTNQ